MNIVKTISEVRNEVKNWRKQGLSVGLVPTMGYLHEGHKSLIDRACKENDKVVVSVFVNPTQFGPGEDLATYPRDIQRDAALCEDAGAALIFNPEPEEMYFDDFHTYVTMESLSDELCGKTRQMCIRDSNINCHGNQYSSFDFCNGLNGNSVYRLHVIDFCQRFFFDELFHFFNDNVRISFALLNQFLSQTYRFAQHKGSFSFFGIQISISGARCV